MTIFLTLNFSFSVLRTSPLTEAQVLPLVQIEAADRRFDFWKAPRSGSGADIMVHAENLLHLQDLLRELEIEFETMIEDVERYYLD